MTSENAFDFSLTRREFLRWLGIGSAAATVAADGVDTSKIIASGQPVENGPISIDTLQRVIPTIIGWENDGNLRAGVFAVDLTAPGKINTIVQVGYPDVLNRDDYDRFPAVQLVRAAGGVPLDFFNKLTASWQSVGKPPKVTREMWLKMLGQVSPEVQKIWQAMEIVPQVNLPEPQGLAFKWQPELLPAGFLAIIVWFTGLRKQTGLHHGH